MSIKEESHENVPRFAARADYESIDDKLLVRMAKNQDLVAIEVLVARYSAALLGFLRTRNPYEYEDLFQETFASALSSLGTLRRDASFGPWLFGIAKRQVASRARSRARDARFTFEDRLQRSGSESTTDTQLGTHSPRTAEENEETELILDCILKQPVPYGLVLYMRLIHERSPNQIASELGMKPSTVRMRLKRGIARLRKSLIQLGLALPQQILEETCDARVPSDHYISEQDG